MPSVHQCMWAQTESLFFNKMWYWSTQLENENSQLVCLLVVFEQPTQCVLVLFQLNYLEQNVPNEYLQGFFTGSCYSSIIYVQSFIFIENNILFVSLSMSVFSVPDTFLTLIFRMTFPFSCLFLSSEDQSLTDS